MTIVWTHNRVPSTRRLTGPQNSLFLSALRCTLVPIKTLTPDQRLAAAHLRNLALHGWAGGWVVAMLQPVNLGVRWSVCTRRRSKYVEENLPDFHFQAQSLNAARAERRAELLAASNPQPSSVPQACRRKHGETAHSTNARKTTHTGRRLPGPAAVLNVTENDVFT